MNVDSNSDTLFNKRKSGRLLDMLERKQEALAKAVNLADQDDKAAQAARSARASKRQDPTAYDILQVGADAPQADIFASYRKLALQWHPDRQPLAKRSQAAQCFRLVQAAYECVKNETARSEYDAMLKQGKARSLRHGLQLRRGGANDNGHRFMHMATDALEAIFWPFEGRGKTKNKIDL